MSGRLHVAEEGAPWRVVCVLGDGRRAGDCGHDHRTQMAAVRCQYAPRVYERDLRAELLVLSIGGE